MKYNNPVEINKLPILIFCFFCFWMFNLPKAICIPDSQSVAFVDYLPKYRTTSTNFIISKVVYTNEEMIFHYIYVADRDNDIIHFYGADREFAWRLTNSIRSESSSVHAITKVADVSNIRLNDESQRVTLNDRSNTIITAKKGDIVTCEIHFELMPVAVRTVYLLGGDCIQKGDPQYRFNSNDILVKTKDSGQLGTEKQMVGTIKQFYKKIGYVTYPDIIGVTTLALEQSFDQKDREDETTKSTNADPIEKHLAPIDYMPQMLTEMQDLKCRERLILTDVHFRENKPDFSARAKAMATINLLIDYLTFNPTAKIVLHGHTDVFGNAFNNLEISKQHVSTVKKTMIAKGVSGARIVTIHHGGSQTLTRYRNGGAMNRRVEVQVLCAEAGMAGKSGQ
jgi:outer membrane protein OmpA-like peptidoglycan-associated protein